MIDECWKQIAMWKVTLNMAKIVLSAGKVKPTIKKKYPHLAKKKILQHNNARDHKCMVVISKLIFDLLSHPLEQV